MSQDPACALPGTAENLSEAYQVQSERLANVYVYVKDGLGNRVYAPPAEPAVLDQKGCKYVPHVLGIVAGQTLRVLNSDPALHNVHPSPEHNEEWNLSQQPRGEPIEKVFDRAELMIPIQCNQHPWMRMYLNVATHPFFAVTKPDGSFAISGLPSGEYTIAALHERMGEKTQRITVAPRESKAMEFSFSQSEAR
jgi:plastocyanin